MASPIDVLRDALDNICDCGTEVYSGPKRKSDGHAALAQMETLVEAAKWIADNCSVEGDDVYFFLDDWDAVVEAVAPFVADPEGTDG